VKTNWDYSSLAPHYVKRAPYCQHLVDSFLELAHITTKSKVCDVGAGVGHLTLQMASHVGRIEAIEPNEKMRKLGIERTIHLANVDWYEGSGERTGREGKSFDLVTFGSSFNVCNRYEALLESGRILRNQGWLLCVWNHRDLKDSIQAEIEKTIKKYVPAYEYGVRREDQTDILWASKKFDRVIQLQSRMIHVQSTTDAVEAWRSHATLQRQSGERFSDVIAAIENLLTSNGAETVSVPYFSTAWLARLKY
jgi:ubiquinone/menaquinone biosynthesis C-methylase UbiE